jgi:hypothetical protein
MICCVSSRTACRTSLTQRASESSLTITFGQMLTDELVLGHEPAGILHQVAQDLEALRAQLDFAVAVEDAAAGKVEPERTRTGIPGGRAVCIAASALHGLPAGFVALFKGS